MLFRRKIDIVEELRKKGAKIGKDCLICSGLDVFSTEPYLVSVGDNVVISTDVKFYCHDGSVMVLNKLYNEKNDLMGTIEVGNNCFFGHGAIILRGTKIGDNCIIGAGAVVKGTFPSNSVIAGVPAKVISNIEEFYKKNKCNLFPTLELSGDEKRIFFEAKNKEREK